MGTMILKIEVSSNLFNIETKFGTQYTNKLHQILTKHSSALKPLLGLLVHRLDFDMHIDFDGPSSIYRVYRMSSSELEE